MIVALTGTPGTGKSTVGKQLRLEGHSVLDLNDIAISENFIIEYDDARDTNEVDITKLNHHLENLIESTKKKDQALDVIFLEGHLAHLVNNIDIIIVLRCHPNELKKRLNKKDWNDAKIRENLEAEAVDAITIECVNNYGQDKVFEIDTSLDTPEIVVENIIKIINGDGENHKPGKIDWSEEILKWY